MRAVCEVFEPREMPSSRSGAGRPSSAKNTAREVVVEMLAGVDQHLLVRAAQRPDTAAALMNCGRLPTTVRTFIRLTSRLPEPQSDFVEVGADPCRDSRALADR